MSIESVMPSNHLIFCCPLLLLTSTFPSNRVFSNESALCIRWPKYWSFSFNISPSKNIQEWFPLGWTGWISLQSKGLSRVFSNTMVQKNQFFNAQLFYSPTLTSIMTTGKALVLARQTFVGKVMSLLFNILSRLVITFLPRSKHLLISWLQSPSAMILDTSKIKVCHCFQFPHLFAMKWWDRMPWSLFLECCVLSQLSLSPLPLSSRGSLVLLCFLP